MTRDEHKQKLSKLLGLATPETQAQISEILSDLSEDYESVLTDSESAHNQVQELTANNETLRSVNAKLFLKVGEIPKEGANTEPLSEPDEPEINVSYDSLFNDKGELI